MQNNSHWNGPGLQPAGGAAPRGMPDQHNRVVDKILGPLGLIALAGAPLVGAILATRPEHAHSVVMGEIGAIFGLIVGIVLSMTIMGVAWLWERFAHLR